jgi:hypothetical protein
MRALDEMLGDMSEEKKKKTLPKLFKFIMNCCSGNHIKLSMI